MSRWLEFTLVLVLYIVSLPVQIVVAGLLLAQLGRPLLFRQTRVGLGGHPIVLFKMRTMTDCCDEAGQPLPDSLRQTALTRFARRLRVDELPQLVMIMRGDMALVGPRPLLAQTLADFGHAAALRNSVRPGLTGWAQVSGNTRLSDREKLMLDLWYVHHRSAALDWRILKETAAVALRGERRDESRVSQAGDWFSRNYAVPAGTAS